MAGRQHLDSPVRPSPARPALSASARAARIRPGAWILTALLLWALGGAGAPWLPATAFAQGAPATIRYDIPPGSLEEVLVRFGRASGSLVAIDQALTAGIRSGGLRGEYSAEAGLAALLAGSGLEAVGMPGGGWRLKRAPRADASVSVFKPIDVTARRDPAEAVYETPAGVAVVTREQIDRLPPRNTSDLLHEVTGVFTSSSRSDPGLSVNIRGMQDFGRVNVMIDGTRQNYQASGHGSNGQVYLDPALVGGVEITKGPISTVGGAGMIAGMVNFRTLDVDDLLDPDQRSGGRVNLSTGDNAYHFVGSAAGAMRLNEDADVLVALSSKYVGAFSVGERGREDARTGGGAISRTTLQDQRSGLFKLGWRPLAGHAFKFSYIGMDTRFVGESAERTAYGTQTNEYQVRSHTLKADYAWRPADTAAWALDANLYYTSTRRRNERAFALDATRGYQLRYQTETVGGSLSNESVFDWGAVSAVWRNGGEFWHDWTSPQFNGGSASLSEGLWYVGPTPEGKRTVASGFTEMTLDYEDWLQLIGGMRYDWYSLSGEGEVFVGSVRNPPGVRPPITTMYTHFGVDRHAGAFAPKLTLAVKPASWAQLYASYGEGLRPPSLTETLMHGMHSSNSFPFYANPNLKEERSRNWEFGVNARWDGLLREKDALRLKAAWFDTRVKNYMLASNVMQPGSTVSCSGLFCSQAYVNLLDPVSLKGLELQVEYDAGHVFGSLTYTRVHADWGRMRYDPFPMGSWVGYPPTDMGSGNQSTLNDYMLGGPPQRKLGVTAGVRLLDAKLELGVRLRYDKPSTLGFMAQYPATRNWDAWATWRPTSALTLRLAVENLTDQKFVEVASGAGGWSWAPGRTVIASLSYNF